MDRELHAFTVREIAGSGDTADVAMERYARGDERAFAVVYAEVAPGLRAWLHRRLRRDAQVDDLVQETFLRIHRHRTSFAPGGRVRPWARSIARRLFIDRLRNEVAWALVLSDEAPPPEHADPAVGPEQWLHARRLAEAMERELSRMTPLRRGAFRRVRLEGRSLGEVADEAGTTTDAVKASVFRAARDLRGSIVGPPRASVRRRRARR